MLLGGLALAFSRLIDDSVVVLENIFRYMEMGVAPHIAAEKGGMEVSLAVLAATSTTSIVFFPGYLLRRCQQIHLHRPGAGRGALDFRVLYLRHDRGAALLRQVHSASPTRKYTTGIETPSFFRRFEIRFNQYFRRMLDYYEVQVTRTLKRPGSDRRWSLSPAWLPSCLECFRFLADRISRAPIPDSS